ncbi:MAG TPA: DoxX family protein [Chloroflexia bacterium]|nr:DoxX family protein [Chloroflexia bacterium]
MARVTGTQHEAWAGSNIAETGTRSGSPVRQFLLGPYPTLISRLVLGGILFLSGMTKLGVPTAFGATINSYELSLPSGLVQAMAVGLPVIELGLGVWLLAGLFTRFSAVLSMVIMFVFLVAITQAWARGLDVNCGCFSGPDGNPVGLAMVGALGPVGQWLSNEKAGPEAIARDLVFLLMGLHLFLVPTIFSLDNLRQRRALAEIDQPEEIDEADNLDEAE